MSYSTPVKKSGMKEAILGHTIVVAIAAPLFWPLRFIVGLMFDIWLGAPFSPGSDRDRTYQEVKSIFTLVITLILLMSALIVLLTRL